MDNILYKYLTDDTYSVEANRLKQKEIRQNKTCASCTCSKCATNCIYNLSKSGVCVGCRRCKESGITRAYITCPIQQYQKLKLGE